MYKKEKEFTFFFFFGRSHTSLEGEGFFKKKKTNRKLFKLIKQNNIFFKKLRVIACYCWKEDGHLFQSL